MIVEAGKAAFLDHWQLTHRVPAISYVSWSLPSQGNCFTVHHIDSYLRDSLVSVMKYEDFSFMS